MTQIRWAPAAADDLEGIGLYLEEHNSSMASSTVRRIFEACESLRQFPNRGRIGRKAGTRELVLAPLPYVVVYSVSNEAVCIARVLHGALNWPGAEKP